MLKFDLDKFLRVFLYNPKQPLIFNTAFFFFLFIGFLFIYQFVHKNQKAKIIYICLFSTYFYYKSNGVFVLLLLFTAISDYILAEYIDKTGSKTKKQILLICSLLINIGILSYFKYAGLFISNINSIFSKNLMTSNIILPIGISFYTFKSLSYIIDVYRGKIKRANNILDYWFFVSFFPEILSGPITRAGEFISQIGRDVFVRKEDIGKALYLILAGLFKKAIIADYISINFVDRVFDNPKLYSGVENLFAVYGYALQIYCDFSGYSDIATGIALLMGFKLCVNFNSPYVSSNLTEFWRRWHISLSTWFRDYVYIPLGGNRKGKIRQYLNLFVTMLLAGLWHGAGWKFIIWGGIHGLGLIFNKIFRSIVGIKENKYFKYLSIIFTFNFVCLAWIFFRAKSYPVAIDIIKQISVNFNGQIFIQLISSFQLVSVLILIGFASHFMPEAVRSKSENIITNSPIFLQAVYVTAMIFLIIQFKSSGIRPYIYFKF
ncbi:MAG: MBOAT family O-acyltransferase [bacterium]